MNTVLFIVILVGNENSGLGTKWSATVIEI